MEDKKCLRGLSDDMTLFKSISSALLTFYRAHARVFPWRQNPTPYHVWISEIMLQQTTTKTVIEYYNRFMTRFPQIEDLARSDINEVLKYWEGLGYYSRAHNLHLAAKKILSFHHGSVPKSEKELLALPGIGPYTAHAILAIAFDQPYIALDGNFLRVGARLLNDHDFIDDKKTQNRISAFWQNCLFEDPSSFNQSIMDIGATICLPRQTPLCFQCPLKKFCAGYQFKTYDTLPFKHERKPKIEENLTVLLFQYKNLFALQKRPTAGLLKGMWQLPSLPEHQSVDEIHTYLKNIGLSALRIQKGPTLNHIFTHKKWTMSSYIIQLDDFSDKDIQKIFEWINYKDLKQKPIPTAFKQFFEFYDQESEQWYTV